MTPGNASRIRLVRILGISLIAAIVSLSAVATAQAGEFRLKGKTFAELGIKEETFEAVASETTLSVPEIGLEIQCQSGQRLGYTLTGGGSNLHSILHHIGCVAGGYPGCTIFNRLEEGTPVEEGKITVEATGELASLGKKHYGVAKSEHFGTIYLEGAKCSLPEENAISGSTAILLPKALEELVKQPFAYLTKAEEKELGIALFCDELPAYVEGPEGVQFLTGPNKGQTFGFE
jgi:hypothetical protein